MSEWKMVSKVGLELTTQNSTERIYLGCTFGTQYVSLH